MWGTTTIHNVGNIFYGGLTTVDGDGKVTSTGLTPQALKAQVKAHVEALLDLGSKRHERAAEVLALANEARVLGEEVDRKLTEPIDPNFDAWSALNRIANWRKQGEAIYRGESAPASDQTAPSSSDRGSTASPSHTKQRSMKNNGVRTSRTTYSSSATTTVRYEFQGGAFTKVEQTYTFTDSTGRHESASLICAASSGGSTDIDPLSESTTSRSCQGEQAISAPLEVDASGRVGSPGAHDDEWTIVDVPANDAEPSRRRGVRVLDRLSAALRGLLARVHGRPGNDVQLGDGPLRRA